VVCSTNAQGAEALKIEDTTYHKRCLRCEVCQTPLNADVPGEFWTKKGEGKLRILCREHYAASVAPCCDSCKKPLSQNNAMKVLGKLLHKECIRCHACACQLRVAPPINEEEKKIEMAIVKNDEKGDALYCKNDYVKLFAGSCPQCDLPVTKGKVLKVANQSYHGECFVCFTCKKPFPDKKFVREKKKREILLY